MRSKKPAKKRAVAEVVPQKPLRVLRIGPYIELVADLREVELLRSERTIEYKRQGFSKVYRCLFGTVLDAENKFEEIYAAMRSI